MTVSALRFDRGTFEIEVADSTRLHLALAEFGRVRLSPTLPAAGWRDDILAETAQRQRGVR